MTKSEIAIAMRRSGMSRAIVGETLGYVPNSFTVIVDPTPDAELRLARRRGETDKQRVFRRLPINCHKPGSL